MSKLKTRVGVDGENHPRIILVPPNSTVREMLELVKTRTKRPDLAYVWLEGAELYPDDPFEDLHKPDAIFCLTSTPEPPSDEFVQAMLKSC